MNHNKISRTLNRALLCFVLSVGHEYVFQTTGMELRSALTFLAKPSRRIRVGIRVAEIPRVAVIVTLAYCNIEIGDKTLYSSRDTDARVNKLVWNRKYHITRSQRVVVSSSLSHLVT